MSVRLPEGLRPGRSFNDSRRLSADPPPCLSLGPSQRRLSEYYGLAGITNSRRFKAAIKVIEHHGDPTIVIEVSHFPQITTAKREREMIGSLTLGSLAVTVLAMTAEAASKGILGESTQRAYMNLKVKITEWTNGDIAVLDRMYTSWTQRVHIAKAIEQRPPADQSSIKELTAALIEALKRDVRQGSVGINVRRLEAMQQQLISVVVT